MQDEDHAHATHADEREWCNGSVGGSVGGSSIVDVGGSVGDVGGSSIVDDLLVRRLLSPPMAYCE